MIPNEVFGFPLSYAQQRLWLHEQLTSGTPAYNVTVSLHLHGTLDVTALERSQNEIIKRHETLRTTFSVVAEVPLQIVSPSLDLKIEMVDLSALPSSERKPYAYRLATEAARKTFDLAHGPLFRTKLICLNEQEHILVLTFHHIIFDEWSMTVFCRELGLLYEAFHADQPSPLLELPIQYADFADWQRQWLQGDMLDQQLSYWKEQLIDAPPLLELPKDHPRPKNQTFQGARQSFVLSNILSEALKVLSRREATTLYMTLLAAFKVLLNYYTQQTDIVIGSVIANRNLVEIEGLIGFFVNSLVLRTNLSGNPSFRELLRRVREMCLGAYAHQDLPFEKLIEDLHPDRDLSRNPLFQVMFVFHDMQIQPLNLPGIKADLLEIYQGTSKFDLTLFIEEVGLGLKATFEYSTALFESATITRMMVHFQNLLEGIAANPDQQLSDLPLLSETERNRLLVEWNATEADYPKDKCVHQLFEEQVERTPDRLALVFEDQQLTYRELNVRANQLAHYLQKLGVRPEDSVGICVERSLELVVGVLGILKSGGAYVPLDPTYPKERLAFILEDTRSPVLLTQASLLERLPEYRGRVVCLGTYRQEMVEENNENPTSGVLTHNLAYVIYTSGSTGRPKGVAIENVQLTNYTNGICDRLSITPGAAFAMVQPLTVDSCITVLFVSLITGGTLHLITWERALNPHALAEYFRATPIDCLKIAPSHLVTLLTSPDAKDIMPRHWLIVGGEVSHWDWVQSLHSLAPDCNIFNHYGPTETTVGVLTFEVGKRPMHQYSTTPIGRSLANTQVYILNTNLQPVPIGVAGELYIGGTSLARGYLNHPELTAERFIPNPFGNESGTRLYQTGDLARYLPDGNVEFLGRSDDQVKIRGLRVELGEIEACLLELKEVDQAVVLAREDIPGDTRLVAYLVVRMGIELSTDELHLVLREKLPQYMIPSAFVFLDNLPMTPHGKVDRRALPAPERSRRELAEGFAAPRTPAEEILASIWAQVLGLERVGIHDNFFDLGGVSLHIIQILGKAKGAGLRFIPAQLFENQTIAELAKVASLMQPAPHEEGIITGPVPFTPPQKQVIFDFCRERYFAVSNWKRQTVEFEAKGNIDPSLLNKAVQHLLVHHDALRMHIERSKSGWQQYISSVSDVVPFVRIDLTSLSESLRENAIELTLEDLQARVCLEGHLFQVALLDLGPLNFSRVILILHHIISDAISVNIIREDLDIAYQQLSSGKPINLPPKTTSYKQWAERIMTYAQSPKICEDLEYWLAEFVKGRSRLPVDFHTGKNTVSTTQTISVSLNIRKTQSLLQMAPRISGVQVLDILLAGLALSFAQWTREHSLFVNVWDHGRPEMFDDIDLSRTVGYFAMPSPRIITVNPACEPLDTLKQVNEQLRHVPNTGVSYGILRYLCQDPEIKEKVHAFPHPDVGFNFVGQYDYVPTESSFFKVHSRRGMVTKTWNRLKKLWEHATHSYLILIEGFIANGQLETIWSFSEDIYYRSTIELLAQKFLDELEAIVTYCELLNDSPTTGKTHQDT